MFVFLYLLEVVAVKKIFIVLCPWALWTKNTRPDVCSRWKMGKVERERSELALRAIDATH